MGKFFVHVFDPQQVWFGIALRQPLQLGPKRSRPVWICRTSHLLYVWTWSRRSFTIFSFHNEAVRYCMSSISITQNHAMAVCPLGIKAAVLSSLCYQHAVAVPDPHPTWSKVRPVLIFHSQRFSLWIFLFCCDQSKNIFSSSSENMNKVDEKLVFLIFVLRNSRQRFNHQVRLWISGARSWFKEREFGWRNVIIPNEIILSLSTGEIDVKTEKNVLLLYGANLWDISIYIDAGEGFIQDTFCLISMFIWSWASFSLPLQLFLCFSDLIKNAQSHKPGGSGQQCPDVDWTPVCVCVCEGDAPGDAGRIKTCPPGSWDPLSSEWIINRRLIHLCHSASLLSSFWSQHLNTKTQTRCVWGENAAGTSSSFCVVDCWEFPAGRPASELQLLESCRVYMCSLIPNDPLSM